MKKPAAVAIAIGMAFAATPIAHADNNWIAMAISLSTGQIRIADAGTSQADAEKTAMKACRAKVSDCYLLASGQGGCIAIAVNAANTKYIGAWGPTREEAESTALATAGGGTILQGHGHCQGDPINS